MKTLVRMGKIFIALPLMTALELTCFLVCSAVSLADHNRARRMVNWVCAHLPDRYWYFE